MKRALILLVLCGCLQTKTFVCGVDADCTGGQGGRCEAEGVCSFLDPFCLSGRRFGEHGGALGGECTVEHELRNACVAGELPPTIGDSCAAVVCDRQASCCDAIWAKSCVKLADQLCGAHCGNWIAVANVESNNMIHTAVLEWNGSEYAPPPTVVRIDGATDRNAWVDARDHVPRLAIGSRGLLTISTPGGDPTSPTFAEFTQFMRPGTQIRAITAVDANGDGTIEIGTVATGLTGSDETLMVLLEQTVDEATIVTEFPDQDPANTMVWADTNGDRRPDVAVGAGSEYRLMQQRDGATFSLDFKVVVPLPDGEPIPPPFQVEFGDLDGDKLPDLVAVGKQVIVNATAPFNALTATTSYQDRPPMRLPTAGLAVDVGDLDGDGRDDVVIASKEGDPAGQIVIMTQWDGSGFRFQTIDDAPPFEMFVLVDIDNDGDLDILGVPPLPAKGLVRMMNLTENGIVAFGPAVSIPTAANAVWVSATNW